MPPASSEAQRKGRAYRLRSQYGLTLAEYSLLLRAQKGGCGVCGRKPLRTRLAVDHDHRTGLIRGLLCFRCNRLLLSKGLDLAALHRSAAAYLDDPPARIVLGTRAVPKKRVPRKAVSRKAASS